MTANKCELPKDKGSSDVTPTIAAIATAGGSAAVALIRLSGAGAIEIATRACRKELGAPRMAALRNIYSSDGFVLDQALVTAFPGPGSYTGEDVVEISTHGGLFITRRVLERFIECGARQADPGEFTQRAFLNGKLDLTQAEAVMDLISAQSDLALRAAQEQLKGALGKQVDTIRQQLIKLAAHIEAWIDFPEEEIDRQTTAQLGNAIVAIQEKIATLLATADQGRILREGLRTVISGLPNTGKSSLLNLLLKTDRAIVSDVAGTTRDTIEERLSIRGILLRLIDTAGLRHTDDQIEHEGIKRARQEAAMADLRLLVADASQAPNVTLPGKLPPSEREILILNKIDLGEHPEWKNYPDAIRISCIKNIGLEQLHDKICSLAELGEADWGEHAVAVNARHQGCLQRAAVALAAAENILSSGDAEMIAFELRDALAAIGEIIGQIDTEEILGEIFSHFCIGK